MRRLNVNEWIIHRILTIRGMRICVSVYANEVKKQLDGEKRRGTGTERQKRSKSTLIFCEIYYPAVLSNTTLFSVPALKYFCFFFPMHMF